MCRRVKASVGSSGFVPEKDMGGKLRGESANASEIWRGVFAVARRQRSGRLAGAMKPKPRAVLIAGLAVAGVWLIAWGGFRLAESSRMTAEKVRTYVGSIDLSQLSGDARARAIRGLSDRLNRLSLEERRRVRLERQWARWLEQMTETEKGEFIEATLPTGFKQMLVSFEQMPEQNRKVAIDDAVKRLRETRAAMEQDGQLPAEALTNAPPALSEELQEKMVKLGLKTYYSESSAQTKAELAPLLEEIQRSMESGRFLRGRRPHD